MSSRLADLYVTDSVDFFDLSEAERDALIKAIERGDAHERRLKRYADTARRVLEHHGVLETGMRPETKRAIGERGHQAEQEMPNLRLGPLRHDPYLHATASVLHHFEQWGRAVKEGDIQAVSHHAERLGHFATKAQYLEALGDPALKHRARAEASRGNLADHNSQLHDSRARWWAPWQAEYRELLGAGWSKNAARDEISQRIGAQAGVSDTTLKKWLP
jgi:hypothetical protein